MTPYQKFLKKWGECKGCNLHKTRNKIVLARGKLPCDVCFIGEAPGTSENDIGEPFRGPAGRLLDRMIARAIDISEVSPRLAFTNVIACIPWEQTKLVNPATKKFRIVRGEKLEEPPVAAITACSDRLLHFLRIAKPRAIVLVGKVAEKYGPTSDEWTTRTIVHPASILRADVSQQEFYAQQAVVTIAEVFKGLS